MFDKKIGVDDLANRIMERYDRNKDGKIKLEGANPHNQAYAATSEMHEKTVANNQVIGLTHGDAVVYNPYKVYESERVTMADMFKSADKDGDKFATKQEVKETIALFDEDKDGFIEDNINPFKKSELEKMEDKFPEERKTETYSVDGEYKAPGELRKPIWSYKEPRSDKIDLKAADSVYETGKYHSGIASDE